MARGRRSGSCRRTQLLPLPDRHIGSEKEERHLLLMDKSLLTGELFLAPLSLDDANVSFNMAVLELCTTHGFMEEVEEKSAVCSYLCLLGMVTTARRMCRSCGRSVSCREGQG
ncbi:hypothetical protein ZWY2020_013454 [Hordeum vulgare]|nr:hypothetical protein ZWY2020_013454 [Hordeum vulgare]